MTKIFISWEVNWNWWRIIKAIIETDWHITVREIARKLNSCKTTIDDHLWSQRYFKKLDIWVPHKLNEFYLTLLKRNETINFWKTWSPVMKNGLYTITFNVKGHVIRMVGLQGHCIFCIYTVVCKKLSRYNNFWKIDIIIL